MFGEGSSAKEVVIDYKFEIGKFPVTIEEYITFIEDTKTHYPEWLEKGSMLRHTTIYNMMKPPAHIQPWFSSHTLLLSCL